MKLLLLITLSLPLSAQIVKHESESTTVYINKCGDKTIKSYKKIMQDGYSSETTTIIKIRACHGRF